jgi:hypothetical protein
VFGKTSILWPFPFFLEVGKPIGDGVVWPKKPNYEIGLEDSREISKNVFDNVGGGGGAAAADVRKIDEGLIY